ncbi:MAG: endonuclease/exonuclease/phosphatase family protein [Candidatus Pacebacteria bacterium]|nr:endonuclease/exonuclease/phosphatase family protein [Candidatus Paceibacterota bacterium]
MKLLTLNTWGSRVPELFEYIRGHAETVDIFCFQEVLRGGVGKTGRDEIKDAFEQLQDMLPEHHGVFFEYGDGGYYGEKSSTLDFTFGVAYFVRKTLPYADLGGTVLFSNEKSWSDFPCRLAAGAMQGVVVGGLAIGNVHGLWQEGTNKRDSGARFEQLAIIQRFFAERAEKVVLCGDFNVIPDTQFVHTLDQQYLNLIETYNVTSTRSTLYEKELRLADYVFVDKSIHVRDFCAEDVAVSDHLPLVVDIA